MRKQGIRLIVIVCILSLLCGCTADAQDEGKVASVAETLETSTESSEISADYETERPETSVAATPEVNKIKEGHLVKTVPELTVVCGGQSVTALNGTSYWSYIEGDCGLGQNSCGVHPLDAQEDMPVLEMTDEFASLVFTYAPDAWSASRWSDDNWGNTEAESEPAEKTEDGTGLVLESGFIYEIYAVWDAIPSNGGNSYYSFYVK